MFFAYFAEERKPSKTKLTADSQAWWRQVRIAVTAEFSFPSSTNTFSRPRSVLQKCRIAIPRDCANLLKSECR